MLIELLEAHSKILAECAIAERLRRNPEITLHPTLYNTPLIYGPDDAKRQMAALYEEYLATASAANLPILLTAPTWRLDVDRVAKAGVPSTINTDAVAFLKGIGETAPNAKPVLVGALTGPRNDCYRPDLAPEADDAEAFHARQIGELAATRVDFLLAQTLSSVVEALGVARAMAGTDRPYFISFCTGTNGRVLDGATLPEAMATIDDDPLLQRRPVGYFVNCTHPKFLLDAYTIGELDRLVGIQANASSKDVTALDGSGATEADPIESWSSAMLELHESHGVAILGGCCGTSLPHMQTLSRL